MIFQGPDGYITPSYYAAKQEHGKVVPTWNYVACELRGRVHVHDDAQWLASQVRALTESFETGRDPQWRVDDAPEHFIELQLKAIVGLEIDVVSIEGKAKLSQNRPDIDHDQVRDNFAQGTLAERSVAERMSLGE